MKKITILTVCLTLFLTGSLYSKTVWVSADGAGTFDGLSEANAVAGFSAGLALITEAGDVLRVLGTVASGAQNLTAKNFVYTIEGDATGSTLTGVSGATRMFTINGSSIGQEVTFKNIIFSGSTNSIGVGGGVFFSNVAVIVKFQNCRFVGNSLAPALTQGGGALHFTNSTVTIEDCLFKGNQVLQNGGAIAIYNACTVTMNRCTFVQNKTTSTTVGGGALYITGAATLVTVTHCTFFENNVGLTNQDFGTIRSDNGSTTITNSLFYNNKVLSVTPPALGGPSDWGSSPNGTQTFNKSLGQWISGNIDNVTGSIVKKNTTPLDPLLSVGANLASSNLTYDDALGKVTYIVPTVPTENSPIGFVATGNDAGAWQSGLTLPALSVNDNEFSANFSFSYNAQTKNLKVLRSNDDSVSLEIYNLMGAKVLSRANANKEENINASSLQSGVYILVVKGSGNKSFSQKFVIN